MYPSKQDQLFGVFVKKTVNSLEGHGAFFTSKIVINGKRDHFLKKIITYFIYYFKSLISVFRNQHDLIYVHFLTHNFPLVWWYKKMQTKPVIINLHGSDINKVKESSTLDFLQKKVLITADEIIVPSLYFKEVLIKRYPELHNPIYIYPSAGIDTKVFKGDNKMATSLTISFVSRIDLGKGWRDFLDIIKQLRLEGIKVQAIIAGDGQEKKKLLNSIERHPYKNQIDYRGFQSKEKLVEIYQTSEIFIFPTELPESLGLVGIEAMACENVVFARNIGGPTGYIKNGENGFLFNSITEVVQQIKNYLALQPEDKHNIQKKALETAQQYDTDKVTQALYSNFKKLCSLK
ncbi:MAG: glycosyltransferase family 4 protein [Psychroflexus halocasei]